MNRPTQKTFFPKARWELDPQVPCPCGSSLRFRECCRNNSNIQEKGREYFLTGNFEQSERAWRAKLTRYVGWVTTHTLFLLSRNPDAIKDLVKTDVGALYEIANNLGWALEIQGKTEAIIHTFDHLIRTVPLPGLEERIVYLKCVWLRHKLNRPEEGEKLISRWNSHEGIKDICLLQIYFEIRCAGLPVTKRFDVLNRLIEESESPAEKLHYSDAKAAYLTIAGDNDDAIRVHESAVDRFLNRVAAEADTGDIFASAVVARSCEMSWKLNRDESLFERSLSYYSKIDLTNHNPKGAAEILHQKGRLLLLNRKFDEAIQCFSNALDQSPSRLLKKLEIV